MRRTSTDTYKQIKEEGLLSRMRWRVYSALFHDGPATAGELDVQGMSRNNVATRMTELRELGVVRESGERACGSTGRNVILWRVSGRLPAKRDTGKRAVSRKDLIRAVKSLGHVRQDEFQRWLCGEVPQSMVAISQAYEILTKGVGL